MFAVALEAREKQHLAREERREQGEAHWRARCEAIRERRLDTAAALSESAADWVSEDTLSMAVDGLLDEFFIDREAADHARNRGTE